MTIDVGLLMLSLALSMAPAAPLVVWPMLLRRVPAPIAAMERKQLDKEYGRHEGEAAGILLPAMFLVGAAWWFALLQIDPLPKDPDTVHVIGLEGWYWGIPALLLGITTASIPVNLMMALRLRERFWGFVQQQELKYKGYVRTGLKVIASCAVITAPLLYGGWRIAANFLPDRLVIHHVFAQPSVQPYTAVSKLQLRKYSSMFTGSASTKRYVRIVFDDGTEWSGNSGWRDRTRHREAEILAWVSRQSGVPVTGE